MAKFLTTSGTTYYIERIIDESTSKLILISPFLSIDQNFIERIQNASKRGVKISILYGKDQLRPKEEKILAEIKNLELFFKENLHAKCYFNEKQMVITSMNLYEYSDKNNREMGVFISKEEHKELFDEAFKEAKSIKEASVVKELKKTKKKHSNNFQNKYKKNNNNEGYCIRCGKEIFFNTVKPLCRNCYELWSKFKNMEYPEKYCHKCGISVETTMEKPLCWRCYKNAPISTSIRAEW